MPGASLTARLLAHNPAARRLLVWATGAGLVAGAVLVVQAWLISVVVDAVFLRGQMLAQVTPLLVALAVSLLVRSVALYAEAVLGQRAANELKQTLRQRLTARLIQLGPLPLRNERAGELVSEVTVAMSGGLGLGRLAVVIHPYPTAAEAIRKVADAYNRTRLTPTVAKLFRLWFGWRR